MKKFLLPESGNYYKANLHCHSTYSDGRLTPEELKEECRSRLPKELRVILDRFDSFVYHNRII